MNEARVECNKIGSGDWIKIQSERESDIIKIEFLFECLLRIEKEIWIEVIWHETSL